MTSNSGSDIEEREFARRSDSVGQYWTTMCCYRVHSP